MWGKLCFHIAMLSFSLNSLGIGDGRSSDVVALPAMASVRDWQLGIDRVRAADRRDGSGLVTSVQRLQLPARQDRSCRAAGAVREILLRRKFKVNWKLAGANHRLGSVNHLASGYPRPLARRSLSDPLIRKPVLQSAWSTRLRRPWVGARTFAGDTAWMLGWRLWSTPPADFNRANR